MRSHWNEVISTTPTGEEIAMSLLWGISIATLGVPMGRQRIPPQVRLASSRV
jgi:hypothetical protein